MSWLKEDVDLWIEKWDVSGTGDSYSRNEAVIALTELTELIDEAFPQENRPHKC